MMSLPDIRCLRYGLLMLGALRCSLISFDGCVNVQTAN